MRRLICILGGVILLLCLISCTERKHSEEKSNSELLETATSFHDEKDTDINLNGMTQCTEEEPLVLFSENMPSAKIFDSFFCDINGDGKEDCIILYSVDNGVEKVTAGIAVCLNQSIYSGIDLDTDHNMTFSSPATVKCEENSAIITMDLKKLDERKVYTYTVTYSFDSTSQEASYIINSSIKE